ncbi:MAG: hypothetical protein AABY22_35580 [Nanoarchaeota archaeon]
MSQELQTIKIKLMDKVPKERRIILKSFAYALCTVINEKCDASISEGTFVIENINEYFNESLADIINKK